MERGHSGPAGAGPREAGRSPEEGAVAVDLGEVDAQLMLLVQGGHLQHPGRRVDTLAQRRHALDLLRGRHARQHQAHLPMPGRCL